MKTLHLLRHAKSDWSDPALADQDRPLNKRGKRARQDVAALVDGWNVDLVVCSTARRTRQTAKPVVGALGCPVSYDERLYAASIDDVLAVARTLPEECDTVMLVGHNPSMEEVTFELCGKSPVYPTAALGSVSLAVDAWSEVAPGVGTLTAFWQP
ncbi:MAG TPA: histidine phosphatase family protein [Acidimicrobiia bacterium]